MVPASFERERLAPLLDALLEPRVGYVSRAWPDELYRRVQLLADRAKMDPLAWLTRLARTPAPVELDELIGGATVSHTAFFRHPEQFEALRERLRQLYQALARPLRVWSAGCATGQEPYSIALCAEAVGVPVQVLATDVGAQCIATAQRGEYPARATRGLPEGTAGQPWSAPAPVRARVRFEVASIAQKVALDASSYDVIFCRNVLLYFSPARATRVLAALSERLEPHGVLAVAPAEVLIRLPDGLERTAVPGFLARSRSEPAPIVAKRSLEAVAATRSPSALSRRSEPLRDVERAHERAARQLAAGDLDAAESTLREHLEHTEQDARAWFLLGEALTQREQPAQARVAFQQAARFASQHDEVDVEADTLRAAALRRANTL